MPGSYVAFNLLPSDPFDLLASCIVSLTQRINKYVCMYVCSPVDAGAGIKFVFTNCKIPCPKSVQHVTIS